MDLAMRQGYGACALPLCGGGRLLRRRSETDRFLFFFSIFIFFVVFSCVLFVFSFMASPRSARTDALSTVREPSVLRLNARRALAADESFAVSRGVTLDACFNCGELAATYARVPAFSRHEAHSAIIARPPRWLRGGAWLGLGDEFLGARVVVHVRVMPVPCLHEDSSCVCRVLTVRVGVPPKVLDIHCRVEAPRDALLGEDDGRAGGLETGLPLSEGLLVGP